MFDGETVSTQQSSSLWEVVPHIHSEIKIKNCGVIPSLPKCQLLEAQKKLSLANKIILPLFLWHFGHAWRGSEFTLRFPKNTTFLLSKKVALFEGKVALFGGKLALTQKNVSHVLLPLPPA